MIQKRISASISASALGVPELPGSTGNLKVAIADANFSYDPATSYAFVRRLRAFNLLDDTHTLDVFTGITGGGGAYTAAVAQVETATAAGTITTAGNASVTVTSTGMTGSPLVIPFAVALSDTAATWAAKARAALAANATIAARFTVSGSSTAIVLTRIIDDAGLANDSALNIALADVTSAGITEAATSANTTNGSAASGTIWERADSLDAEGVDFPNLGLDIKFLQFNCIRGGVAIISAGGTQVFVNAGDTFVLGNSLNGIALGNVLSFVPSTNNACEMEMFFVVSKD